MKLFDSHAHLQDDRIWSDHASITARARDAGVTNIVCCGSCEKDWDRVAILADMYQNLIIPAFGLHPLYYRFRSAMWLENLESMLLKYPNAAVGECGLDHTLHDGNNSEMYDVFISQIELAQRLKRPLSIHCRKAWLSLETALKQCSSFKIQGVVHSWSGSIELVRSVLEYGLSISFSGALTNERNLRAGAAALEVPIDRLLVETDSPDLAPFTRNPPNEPSYIIDTIKKLAQIRKIDPEAAATATYNNGLSIFRF